MSVAVKASLIPPLRKSGNGELGAWEIYCNGSGKKPSRYNGENRSKLK